MRNSELSSLDWDKLETFYYVAKAGSFALASKQLDIAQPAISRQIKILEEQLGVKLFYRTGRGLTLTPEGEKFLKAVTYMFAELKEAVDSLYDHKDKRPGRGYDKYLLEFKRIVGLDYRAICRRQGKEAAEIMLNDVVDMAKIDLNEFRDELLEAGK